MPVARDRMLWGEHQPIFLLASQASWFTHPAVIANATGPAKFDGLKPWPATTAPIAMSTAVMKSCNIKLIMKRILRFR